MSNKQSLNPSTNVKIIYTQHDYNTLLENGAATYGDLIIGTDSDGNAVLHINDNDYYFGGMATYVQYDDDPAEKEKTEKQFYLKLYNDANDLIIPGTYKGNSVDVTNLISSNIYYRNINNVKTPFITVTNRPNSRKYYYINIGDEYTTPVVQDLQIGDKLISDIYVDQITYDNDKKELVTLTKLDEELKKLLDIVDQKNVQLSNNIKTLNKNTSTKIDNVYTYIAQSKQYDFTNAPETDNIIYKSLDDIKTQEQAINILLENAYYKYPEPFDIEYEVIPESFIYGNTTPIEFKWHIKNYNNLENALSVKFNDENHNNEYRHERIIKPNDHDIIGTLYVNLHPMYKDERGNLPEPYTKTLICKKIIEEYYLCTTDNFNNITEISDIIDLDNSLDYITKNSNVLNSAIDNNIYKQYKNINIYNNGYLYMFIEYNSNNTYTLIQENYNGVLKNIPNPVSYLGICKLRKYDIPVQYNVYKFNNIVTAGLYHIQQFSIGTSYQTLYWEEI